MKRTANLILIIILILSISFDLYSKKDKADHLPGKYKKWLERDVIYIITPLEKEVFLKLKSDRERDYFIQAFWKQRDPNPNTPANEFKIDHYKRIKYANMYFSKEAPGPGWKSDMGRIYIILGEPDHKSKYLNETGIRPLQIWNYSGKMAYGLPNTFNVVFFQRDGTGEFKLYSPLKFGPASLLENYMGDPQNHLAAYSKLFEIEPTVASISLSLLPHEEQVTSPSLASESLITAKIPAASHNKINDGYANKILDYKGFVKVEYMIDMTIFSIQTLNW